MRSYRVKWCPGASLATECAEIVRLEYLASQLNKGVTSLMYIVELIHTKKLDIKALVVLSRPQQRRKNINTLLHFGLSGLDICDHLYECFWTCWIENLLLITNMKFREQKFSWTELLQFSYVLHIWDCPGHPYLLSTDSMIMSNIL